MKSEDVDTMFVAMNIILITNNIKMLLVGNEKPNLPLRCAIASELLDELETVPLGFFNVSSTGSVSENSVHVNSRFC